VKLNRLIRGVAAISVAALAGTAFAAGAAAASTVGGTLTLNTPGAGVLNAGGSQTPFTVNPTTGTPPTCTNTGPNGYQQLGYMIPNGDPITGAVYNTTTSNFTSGASTYGFLLQTSTLVNYGPENPGAGGVLLGSPTLQFNPSNATTDLNLTAANSPVIWNVGVACFASNTAFNPNPNPVANQIVDNWNCQVSFLWAPADPAGYTWTTNCGNVPTPEVPMAAALPLAGLGVAAVAFGGTTYVRRRRSTRPLAAA
jgi:hypothetical protein